MSAEYTPTTDAMRERASRLPLTPGMSIDAYDWNHRLEAARRAEFDRWLVALIAQVRVDTLRDAAAQARKGWAPEACPWVGFLDDRADRIEGVS